MSDTSDSTLTPSRPEAAALRSQPTFGKALRGIWLFTWKPQLTWRRLRLVWLSLLALPLLVFITTPTPDAWSRRHSFLGYPPAQLAEFSKLLARVQLKLRAEQKTNLLQILTEEGARTEDQWREARPGESDLGRQRAEIERCYQRIHSRAEAVLDEPQFVVFQNFENRKVTELQGHLEHWRWNRTGPFYHWLIDVYFFVLLPLNCVRVCGALIRDEIQADTLGFLATRPLSRARLLILKYCTQVAWLQILVLLEALLLLAAGTRREIPALGSLLPLFLAAQFLAVLAWSALGALLGQATNRYMALALLYGLVVELGIGHIPTNINTLSLMRHLKCLLAHHPALQNVYGWSGHGVTISVSALVLAAGIFLALAALLFTFKEYQCNSEKS